MQRVTLRTIAEAVGLSRMSVSLALRGHASIPEPTRRRVAAAARRLGYVPDANLSTAMARLRSGPTPGEPVNLAVLNCCREERALADFVTFRRFLRGLRRRGAALGFSVETIWARDPAIDPPRLREILLARGVQGVLTVRSERDSPPRVAEVFAGPVVQLGQRADGEAFDFASNDQFATTQLAVRRLWDAGARRFGLAIGAADLTVDARYSGGFFSMAAALPGAFLAPVFCPDDARATAVRAWVRAHRLDAVLVHDAPAAGWLLEWRNRPRRLQVAHLDWNNNRPDLPGTDQQSELVGEVAVERLIAKIRLPAAAGHLPAQGLFVQSVWREAAG